MQAEDKHKHLMVSYQTCWSRETVNNNPPEFNCEAGQSTGFSDDTYNCDPLCKYQWMLWNNAFKMQYVQALGLFYVYSILLNVWGGILAYLWLNEFQKNLDINSTGDMIRASQLVWTDEEVVEE